MQFERWVSLDLAKGHEARVDLGTLYAGDSNPVKLGVILTDNGEAVEVTGTVSGWGIMASGETSSPFGYGKSGNTAWVEIPQGAMAYPGKLEIFLRITDQSNAAVMVYATAIVKRTSTSTVINPGTVVQDIAALISEAQAVVDDAFVATVSGTTLVLGPVNSD